MRPDLPPDMPPSGTALFEVPFTYDLKFVPAGKRKPHDHTILDSAQIAVPAVTDAEAPVALRWKPNFRHSDWRSETPLDHRWWHGRIWRPFSRTASREESVLLSVDDAKSIIAEHGYANPFRTGLEHYRIRDTKPLSDLQGGKIVTPHEKDRAGKIDDLTRRAADLLVVEGIIYEPTEEPVYKIGSSGYSSRRDFPDEPWLHVETVPWSSVGPNDPPDRIFRVDRKDDVLALLAETEERHGARGRSPEELNRWLEKAFWGPVEVLMPEVLRFVRDLGPRQDMLIGHVLGHMAGELAGATVPYFTAYAALRDMQAAPDRDRDAVVEHIRSAIIPQLGDGHYAQTASNIVQEWVDRPDIAAISESDIAAVA